MRASCFAKVIIFIVINLHKSRTQGAHEDNEDYGDDMAQ